MNRFPVFHYIPLKSYTELVQRLWVISGHPLIHLNFINFHQSGMKFPVISIRFFLYSMNVVMLQFVFLWSFFFFFAFERSFYIVCVKFISLSDSFVVATSSAWDNTILNHLPPCWYSHWPLEHVILPAETFYMEAHSGHFCIWKNTLFAL